MTVPVFEQPAQTVPYPPLAPTFDLAIGPYNLSPYNNPGPFVIEVGADLGDPVAVITAIESYIVDGDRVTGRRLGNRTKLSLPITIRATDRLTVDQAKSALKVLVDSPAFQISYRPMGGLYTGIIECFRGDIETDYQPEQLSPDDEIHGRHASHVTVTAGARPLTRGTLRKTLVASAASTVLDSMDAAAAGDSMIAFYQGAVQNGATTQDRTYKVQGAASLFGSINPTLPATIQLRRETPLAGPTDVSADGVFRVWAAWQAGSPGDSYNVSVPFGVQVVITDSAGNTTFVTAQQSGSPVTVSPITFYPFIVDLTKVTGVDLTKVTSIVSYADVALSSYTPYPGSGHTLTVDLWLDDLEARSTLSSSVAVTNGGTYTLPAVPGDARTEVSLALTCPAGETLGGVVVYVAPPEAPASYQPIVPLKGQQSQSVYTPVTPVARYDGTCRVLLAVARGSAPSPGRAVTVTFQQFMDITNGDSHSDSVQLVVDYTDEDISSGLLDVGAVNLPIRALADDNTNGGYFITVAGSDAGSNGDTYVDMLVLDTRGWTYVMKQCLAQTAMWLDEPATNNVSDSLVLVGPDRNRAVSCYDDTTSDGGPLTITGGVANTLAIYHTNGALGAVASFWPRWYGNPLSA